MNHDSVIAASDSYFLNRIAFRSFVTKHRYHVEKINGQWGVQAHWG